MIKKQIFKSERMIESECNRKAFKKAIYMVLTFVAAIAVLSLNYN